MAMRPYDMRRVPDMVASPLNGDLVRRSHSEKSYIVENGAAHR